MDVESINKEILRAQLEEQPIVKSETKGPSVRNESFSPFSSSTEHHQPIDLRAEVIDPSFDFEGPKVEIDDL
jgi:hypothetical protein